MAAMRQSITGKERGRKEGRGRPGEVGNATSRAEEEGGWSKEGGWELRQEN